jgi:peptidoglycan/xylan/chitin deacetylase (PgdA/CDA1 family)
VSDENLAFGNLFHEARRPSGTVSRRRITTRDARRCLQHRLRSRAAPGIHDPAPAGSAPFVKQVLRPSCTGVTRSRRDRAAALLAAPGISTAARRLPRWRGVLTLNYHRVGDATGQPWDRTLWSATAEAFDAQLGVLAREAEVIAPDDVEAALRSGRRGRRVLITFDDGYRDNYEVAFPLLRRHGLPATFFLATGFLDRPHVAWWDELAWMVRRDGGDAAGHDAQIAQLCERYKSLPADQAAALLDEVAERTGAGRCPAAEAAKLWMTWDHARELRDAGMRIGGHTVTHPLLSRVPAERQREEIAGCAQRLQDELGAPMRWFAYPVGSRNAFTPATQQILADHDVELAFSFYGGWGRFDHWQALDVPRVHVGPNYSSQLVFAALLAPRAFARW